MTDTIIEITLGRIRGTTENGVHAFKGIPYGGPTGGLNRFMPPTAPEPWSGVRDASRYGPSSWQALEYVTRIGILGAAGIDSMSEDCLVLNVWTRGLRDQGKRPVMVWIHGGGFFSGSGDQLPCYEGASLADAGDVVVVSVNHRLGAFGFLHLRELAGEKYSDSGNAGMLDLVAALDWVRDNIETFGGDPDNVTIFGESGGGAKVSLLLGMRGSLKSCHTLEIPFVFNNMEPTVRILGDAPERLTLAEKMSGAWIAFARNGDPNHEGLQNWPAYSAENRATMLFDNECRVEIDPGSNERKAWEGIV